MTLPEVLNYQDTTCISKIRGHHFPCWYCDLCFLWGGREGMFPLLWLCLHLWLAMMDSELIHGNELCRKILRICFKEVQIFSRYRSPCSPLIWNQEARLLASRDLWDAKFIDQFVVTSLLGNVHPHCYLTSWQSSILHQNLDDTVNVFRCDQCRRFPWH